MKHSEYKKEILRQSLENYIDAQKGEIALSLSIQDKKIYVGINDAMYFHAASTMKVPLMCELFREIETGKMHLDDRVRVKNEFVSIIDGSKYHLNIADDSTDILYSMIGKSVTVEFLIKDMITMSGNLSTNNLIELVRPENVRSFMKRIGADEMRILRGVEDIKAFRAGKNNVTTARALTAVFDAILYERVCGNYYTVRMLEILKQQKFRDKIPARLPAGIEVAHKTGSISYASHDAGIIFTQNMPPYVLSILTSGFKNGPQANGCIAEISKQIYDWYTSL